MCILSVLLDLPSQVLGIFLTLTGRRVHVLNGESFDVATLTAEATEPVANIDIVPAAPWCLVRIVSELFVDVAR
jgi:hypothetical protein